MIDLSYLFINVELGCCICRYQVRAENCAEVGTQSSLDQEHSETKGRFTSPARELHLETSKIINIDVPPSEPVSRIPCLSYSETVNVNVPPTGKRATSHDEEYFDCYTGEDYEDRPTMMDKAEDVLRQRIRELEKLEKHLKQQVNTWQGVCVI